MFKGRRRLKGAIAVQTPAEKQKAEPRRSLADTDKFVVREEKALTLYLVDKTIGACAFLLTVSCVFLRVERKAA